MAALIPFTSNYTDVSTYEGYQFEFHCQRCGNGYRSAFRHSVTGFGGRLAALGGGILGGDIGSRVQEVGPAADGRAAGLRAATGVRPAAGVAAPPRPPEQPGGVLHELRCDDRGTVLRPVRHPPRPARLHGLRRPGPRHALLPAVRHAPPALPRVSVSTTASLRFDDGESRIPSR